MTLDERKATLLHRQHLTDRTDKLTVVRDLCGLQAQFMVNARHALEMRCDEPITDENFGVDLVKNWTIRGTVHIFAEADLPLFKHDGAHYRSHDWSDHYRYSSSEPILTYEQYRHWTEFIVEQVAAGVSEREALKAVCTAHGMTQDELDCMFDPWGGGMRALCERGFLNYAVQEKKAFVLCPPYAPMDTPDAERELVRRYFAHYAPATLRDAAYYFGWPQSKIKAIMHDLPVECVTVDGRDCFYLDPLPTDCADIPRCLLLAGFDQLMLGYRKEDSIFLPPEHLRGIFNLAGIVMPPILLDGRVVGRWRHKGSRMTLEPFEPLDSASKRIITDTVEAQFPGLRRIDWGD